MEAPLPPLRLRLVGQVSLTCADGAELTPRGVKTQGVLVLIGSAPNLRRSRAFLQDKLWSDRGPDQGSASLRQALVELRRALGEHRDCLVSEANMVGLDPGRVRVVLIPEADDWGALGETPEFAEGLDIADPEFEDWIRDQRSAFAERLALEPRPVAAPRPTRPAPLPGPAGPASRPGAAAGRPGAEVGLLARLRPRFRRWQALALGGALLVLLLSLVRLGGALLTPAEGDDFASGLSVAVMPFESAVSDPDERGFGKAVAHEIVTRLAGIPQFFVIDASVLAGGESNDDGPAEVVRAGRALGVRYVLRGLVQRSDGLVRANVHLVQLDNGRTIWATRIEGNAGATLALQDEITQGVVTNLEHILIPLCGARVPGTRC